MLEYFLWSVAIYGWFLHTRSERISKMYGMWFFALSTIIRVTARKNRNEVIKYSFFPQALKIRTVCHGAKWHGNWTSVPTIVFKKCSWILTDLWVIVSSWLKTIGLCMPWDMGGPQPPSVYLLDKSCVSDTICQGRAPGAGAQCSMFELQSQLFLSCLNTLFEEMYQIKCILCAFLEEAVFPWCKFTSDNVLL